MNTELGGSGHAYFKYYHPSIDGRTGFYGFFAQCASTHNGKVELFWPHVSYWKLPTGFGYQRQGGSN
jgi:hypothetical protein